MDHVWSIQGVNECSWVWANGYSSSMFWVRTKGFPRFERLFCGPQVMKRSLAIKVELRWVIAVNIVSYLLYKKSVSPSMYICTNCFSVSTNSEDFLIHFGMQKFECRYCRMRHGLFLADLPRSLHSQWFAIQSQQFSEGWFPLVHEVISDPQVLCLRF